MGFVNDTIYACVRIASTITAQGLLKARHPDGTITISVGTHEVTGVPV